MCGIIALVSFKNHRHNLAKLDEMARMIKHRGPDDEGFALFSNNSQDYNIYYGKDTPQNVIKSNLNYTPNENYLYPSEEYTVGIAHRRLSIIDLTASGHQPMCDESTRYWITYNGEIYNFREIRVELKKLGYSFFSNTDTEVILKAYMAWGEECQSMFNGMWALAIWDNVNKSLWISRDRFGVKPLYYMLHNDFFAVFSEIKSILRIVNITPNLKEVYAYLIDGPSEAHPETFFDGVYRFPTGTSATNNVRKNPGKLFFKKYWELDSPSNDNSFSKKKLQKYLEEFYLLLEDAVKIRLHADVKVGCALSGGLDSSFISFYAKNILKKEGRKGNLTTFSNVYHNENEKYCDESKYIDLVVQYLGLQSSRGTIDTRDILNLNDKGLWHAENCYDYFSAAFLNTYSICKKSGITVALDGQGADEQLGGYNYFWNSYLYARSKLKYEYWMSLFSGVRPFKSTLKYAFLGNDYSGKSVDNSIYSFIDEELDCDYRISRNVNSPRSYFNTINEEANWSMNNNIKRVLRANDSNSMAYSVESRQPFMDYRLVVFLNELPDTYKMYKGWTKYIARIAFNNKLPNEVVWRKDKMGWPSPYKAWVSGEILDRINRSIKESEFLKGVFHNNNNILDLYRNDAGEASRMNSRLYLRFYNVARVANMFYERRMYVNDQV